MTLRVAYEIEGVDRNGIRRRKVLAWTVEGAWLWVDHPSSNRGLTARPWGPVVDVGVGREERSSSFSQPSPPRSEVPGAFPEV